MNFDLSEDQVALRDGIRAVVAGKFPMTRVRAGFDTSTWQDVAAAGVIGLRVEGFAWTDAAVVLEELGRALVPGPIVWGVLAASSVPAGAVGGVECPKAGECFVEHLRALRTLLVLDDAGVHRIDPEVLDASEVAWPLDPLTPISRVDALVRGERIAGPDVAARWRIEGATLTAAYLVGMAAACTDLAVEHAKERRQFDRPIGSFQAVKHLCADMAVRTEVARAAVHAAACHLDDPELGDRARAVSGAKLLAGEGALANAKAAMQVHGGMGFTWEVDVHLYLKRAWVLDTVFGSAHEHADTVAASLSLSAPIAPVPGDQDGE